MFRSLLTPFVLLSCFTTTALAQRGPALVAVSPVVEREVSQGRTFIGVVRPARVSSIGSAVDGRVEEFYVNEGDRVEKGAELAKLRTRTLELERDAASAEADALAAMVQELEIGTEPELERARAAVGAAESNARYTKLRVQRAQELIRTGGAVAREEFQEYSSMANQAADQVRQAKASLQLVELGRPQQIIAAKAKLLAQRDLVERFDDRIKLHTIRAPFAGFVTIEHTEVGQWVKMGDLVVEMAELDSVDVEVGVIEEAIVGVRLGAEARVEVSALGDKVFTGEIVRIVPQSERTSKTFPVKIRVENSIEGGSPVLKSNMFARATLAVGVPRKMTMVPKDALVLGGRDILVYVVMETKDGPVAKPVPVGLGVADAGFIEVDADLKPGQQVVTRGNERLRPMQSVKITRTIDVSKE